MVHDSEMKYGTYHDCPEKYSTILLPAQAAHVRRCAPHTVTRAIAKNDIVTKKSGIFEKISGIASGASAANAFQLGTAFNTPAFFLLQEQFLNLTT